MQRNDSQRSFWTDARLHRFSVAIWISIAIALLYSFFFTNSDEGIMFGGDFPGFYVLGEILHRGEWLNLYDPALQRSIENELWPSFGGKFYMSVYPPFVAFFMYPFTLFGPHLGQLIFTITMLLCLFKAAAKICSENQSASQLLFPICTFFILFAPFFASVFGAQNTALSTLILLLSLKNPLWAPLLLYKPQFGVLWCIYIFFRSPNVRLLVKMLLVTSTLYILGALVSGWAWPLQWVSIAGSFGEQNFQSNLFNLVSLQGFIWWLSSSAHIAWKDVSLIGYLLSGTIFLALILRRSPPPLVMRYLPLIAPQTLFYDLGIALTGMSLSWQINDKTIWRGLILIMLSWAAFFLRDYFYFPVFFPFYLLLLKVTSQKTSTN